MLALLDSDAVTSNVRELLKLTVADEVLLGDCVAESDADSDTSLDDEGVTVVLGNDFVRSSVDDGVRRVSVTDDD